MTIIYRTLRGDLPRALRESGGDYDHIAARIYDNLIPYDTDSLRDGANPVIYRQFGERVREAIKSGDTAGLRGETPPNMSEVTMQLVLDKVHMVKCVFCGRLADKEGSVIDDRRHTVGACCKENYRRSVTMNTWILAMSALPYVNDTGEADVVTRNFAENNARLHRGRNVWVHPNYWGEYLARYPLPPEPHPVYGTNDPWDNALIPIGTYHSSIGLLRQLPSPKYDEQPKPLRVGIELEINVGEGFKPATVAYEIKKILNETDKYALCENDSSVGHGFEIVTAWSGLDTHERILSRMGEAAFQALIKKFHMRSHNTTTCGLHVTIDRAGMTKLHLAKMVVFLNHPGNRVLVEKICRRYAQNYCKIKHDKFAHLTHVTETRDENPDRYEILNTTKRSVLEFRGPRGTLRWQSIMAAMQFIRALWLFTEQADSENLNTESFLDYVWGAALPAEETAHLRDFLTRRRISPGKALPPAEVPGRSAAEVSTASAELAVEV